MVDFSDVCEAEANTWEESRVQAERGWITCTMTAGHDGPHKCISAPPCMTCGGLESHYDGCSNMNELSYELLIITFDDEGWQWVAPEDVKEKPRGNNLGGPFA